MSEASDGRGEALLFKPELRPDFNHHVTSPFGHYIVNARLNEFRAWLDSLPYTEVWRVVSELKLGIGGRSPRWETPDLPTHSITALFNLLHTFAYRRDQQRKFPEVEFDTPLAERLVGSVSMRQRAALAQFTNAANRPDFNGRFADSLLFNEVRTITDTTQLLQERHPALQLHDMQHLVAWLRQPELPGTMRGFMTGGNGFVDGFHGRNSNPTTFPWVRDGTKPVIRLVGNTWRVTGEVAAAALNHRLYSAELPAGVPINQGGVEPRFHHSSGCPMRHLAFEIDVMSLKAAGVELSQTQLNLLTEGEGTIAGPHPHKPDTFVVHRDGIANILLMAAEALERADQIMNGNSVTAAGKVAVKSVQEW